MLIIMTGNVRYIVLTMHVDHTCVPKLAKDMAISQDTLVTASLVGSRPRMAKFPSRDHGFSKRQMSIFDAGILALWG